MFDGKKIVVGVTGGIAAYKTCELVRELKKNNAQVQVVMTEAATRFITPLTLATLSEKPVLLDLFADRISNPTVHIDVARWADAILVCPATANTIGKVAAGLADNLLTTLILATTAPVIFCPAMNKEMYRNAICQKNMDQLSQQGHHFVKSDEGELACGEYGWGRLAELVSILNRLKKVLLGTNALSGKRVLITAGRTEEPLDPVRIFTNYSSGKMGFALAEAAALKGADVTLISGPNDLSPFDGVRLIRIQTSEQMADAVQQEIERQDIVIMSAAVADFAPATFSDQKLKKAEATASFEFKRTKDILKTVGQSKGNMILVGFAVETENERENSLKKLREKNLDLIVTNNPKVEGAAFAVDTNIVTLMTRDGQVEAVPMMTKKLLAHKIMDRIIALTPNGR
ncbi:MAG: bifunctional phosphopantothenoylcysteine decarboxylase/phosphopantothenate--cysteine ligase CoaBC [Candidatus Zhuqueibacterota bacterium]